MSAFWSFVKGLLRKQYRGARRPRTQYRRTTLFTRLRFDELEVRVVPNSYSWTGGAGTLNWGDMNNWSGHVVPSASDDVTINISVSGTITVAGTQSVRTLNDTTAALSIASGGSLSLAAVAATSTFGQNVTVGAGGTLTVGAGASVQLGTVASMTLQDNGTLTFATGDTVTLDGNARSQSNVTGQVVVGNGGLLTASGTAFDGSVSNDNGFVGTALLSVASGGHLQASSSTFALSYVSLSVGAVVNSGDLNGDAFDNTLFIPAIDVQYLSGTGNSNLRFKDIDIQPDTLTSGQSVTLSAIGTQTTANLRYVFPGNFTINSGASLAVGAGVPVLIGTGSSLTLQDNGTLTFASGDTVTVAGNAMSQSNVTGQVVVGNGGLLSASGTTFNDSVSNDNGFVGTALMSVASGGHLQASSSTFALSYVSLSVGAVGNRGDFSGDAFDCPLFIPAIDVQYLSGPSDSNLRFKDIDIQPDTLTSGQSVTLSAIGTQTTANLRYVFPGNFTINSGASLAVGAGVPVLIGTGSSLTLQDNGTLTFASGDTVTVAGNAMSQSNVTGQVVVGNGGLLSASGTTFNDSVSNDNGFVGTALMSVASGGQFTATTSSFALSSLTLSSGSTDTVQFDTFSCPLAINSGATLTINANDLTNVPGNNSGIVATGSPTATINLTNNFWGTGATAAQIAAKIKDHVTDSSRPTVLYQPFLSAEPTQTTAATAGTTYTTAAQNVNLSATVIYPGGNVNQGTLTFTILNGSTTIGSAVTVNVSGGVASATYTLPGGTPDGTYTIQAVYNGTSTYAGSSDSSHLLTVSPNSYSWTGNAGTLNWGDANNWSGQVVPGSGDNVTISKSGVGTITIAGTQSVRTLNDTTAVLSIASGGSLSLAAVAATSTFGQNVTVQSGGTLAVGAGVTVLLQNGVTLTDSGTVTLASGDTVTFNGYNSTQLVVAGGGLLSASGTTFNVIYSGSITVNSGGQFTPSGCALDLPLYLPAANVADLGGASSNVSFQDINIVAGTLGSGQALALNAIGTDTSKLRYVFPGNFTVASGATMSVAANVPVLLQNGVTLTDSGTVTLASGDTVTFNGYNSTQLVVAGGGLLSASGTTFNVIYSGSITVNSGGQFTPSGCALDLPLYLPAANVADLGGASSNVSFQDINIVAGTLGSGQALALNAIGTDTSKLRYVFPGNFTVASGATMSVAANVPVLLQNGVTLTDSGTVTLASGDTVTFNGYNSTQLVVAGGGLLSASGTTFNVIYSGSITVNSGGQFTPSGCALDLPLYLPAANVADLGGASSNVSFQDINIVAGTLGSGQALALNAIGTDTSKLRYVFPGNFTVASGATMSVAANVPVLLQNGVTLTDSGTVTLASGDTVTFNGYNSTQLVVAGGGLLSASGTTFNVIYSGSITVNSGGQFTPSDCALDLPLYLPAANVADLGGASSNVSFQDINIVAGTLGSGQALALNAIGTDTSKLRYVFPGNFTVASGATMSVAANVPVLLQNGVTLTDSGTVTLASGDTVTFNGYNSTQLVVAGGGLLSASGTTFNVIYSGSITVNSGGQFTPSGCALDLPLYLPAANVADLGGASSNVSFQDINIVAGTLGSGQALALNAIGTDTSKLRYVFPGNFTVASGATMSVAANVPVLLQNGVTLTDSGTVTLASGDTVTFNGYNSTQLVVAGGGLLSASGTTFNVIYSGSITVNSGGQFTPSGCALDLPLYLPAANVADLGGASSNVSFQDINIVAGTLGSGQALALNAIGTDTSKLRYVFPGNFTVASGATMSVAANVPVLLQNGVTLTDSGTVTLASGDTVTFNGYNSTQLVVAGGGLLSASGTTFNVIYSGSITVNSGGHLQASGSSFSVGNVTLSSGSTDTIQFDTFSSQLAIDSGATRTINQNDLSNVPGSNNGIIATGSSTATINLTNNFWGTGATASQIAAKIKDHVTDATRPTVLYQPYLTVLPTQTTAAAASTTFNTAAQNVTLSATVLGPGGGVSQGTATFTVLNGPTAIGSPVTVNVTSGVATATYILPAATPAATYTIQAVYNGTSSYSGSSDTSHLLTVSAAAATTAAANASTTFNSASQSVALGATVTSAAGTVNEGTETFTILSGIIVIGSPVTGNVTSGAVSVSYTLPAATSGGTYTIQAVYNGTTNFTTSTDTSHSLTVNGGATTTAAANASATYAVGSQTVPLSATVSSAAGTVNEGTETFTILNGSTPVGNSVTGNVSSGAASANYTLPGGTTGGTYTIKAVYNGTINFTTSTDTSHSLTVSAASTTTAAANASTTYSAASQAVSLSATVTSSGGTVNAGTETFTILSGSTVVGSPVTVNVSSSGGASASYTLPAGTVGGSYTIKAVYNGTANFTTSTDTSHTLTVNAATATTTAASAAAVFAASQTVALSASVTSSAGTVNGGTVTFTLLNGSNVIGSPTTGNVVNGAASANYTLPAGLADGSYTIQAAYSGTANFGSSTDSSQSLFVGTIIWVASGGGSWDTASNWSPQRVPTTTDDVVIVRPGATVTKSGGSINVRSVISTAALSVSSASMTITAGPSQFQAGLTLTSGTFNFNGGSITSGTVTLTNSALVIGPGTGAANFVLQGSDTLTGNVAVGQTLTVEGNTAAGNATLTTVGNVTNDGTIVLESVNSNYNETLATGSDTFTNAADGTIHAGLGTGSRTISGTLVNQGQIVADANQFLTVQGAYYAAGGACNGYLINCTLYVTASPASPTTIVLGGGGDVLATDNLANTTLYVIGIGNWGDATLTVGAGLSNHGTILLQSVSSNYNETLATGSNTFTNAADGTIHAGLGTGGARTISGTLVNQGQIVADANQFLTVQGAYYAAGGACNGYLINCTLYVTASPASPTTIVLGGGGDVLATDNLANTTLYVIGIGNWGNATLTVGAGLSNDGTILLQSVSSNWSETLSLAGTLTNAADGTIQVTANSGGARTITGTLINAGTINFDTNTTLGSSGAKYINGGLISISGSTVTVVGTSFTNNIGGLISGDGTFNTSGVTFTNNGIIDLSRPSILGVDAEQSFVAITYDDAGAMNVATVTNPANYKLLASGGDGIFGNGNDVDESSLISQVTYSSTTKTATLQLSSLLPLDVYWVEVNGSTVLDASGTPLLAGQTDLVNRVVGLLPAVVSPTLDPASDSGLPNHPGYTHVTTPTFDFQVNQAGTIAVDFDGNGTTDATLTVSAAGTYQLTAQKLADGTYTAIATFTAATGVSGQGSTTYTIDTATPAVTALSPSGPVYTAISQVTATFNELVDLNTFTPAAITLTGPNGTIAVNQPQLVSGTTYSISFPQQTAQGTYSLTVASSVTDFAANPMKQPFSGSFTIGLPDLAVTYTSAPSSGVEGASTPVSWTVADQSPTNPAVSTWTDTVYLSTRSALDNTATKLLSVAAPPSSPLAANGNYTRNESVTIPTNIPTGAYYLLFAANADGGQLESDSGHDANDVAADAITLYEAATTTTAASAAAFYAVGSQSVYLNASVTNSAGTVNGGTATFTLLSGNTVVGSPVTVNVTSGAAPATYTVPAGTAVGSYTIQVVYSGTGNFTGSSDASHSLTVKPAFTTTSAANTLAPYSAASQTVPLSASVTSPGGTVNEGMETFTLLNGNTVIGSPVAVGVAGGGASANYTLPAGTVDGTYTIQVVYTDPANFLGSSDIRHFLTVGPAATTTAAVTASTGTSAASQTVALSASVTSPIFTPNEGSVTFTVLSGSTVIGTPTTANVTNGSAGVNYTLPAGLADGIYTIQAAYNGTAHFAASTDSSQDLLVDTIVWASATGGSWDNPNNWLPQRLPRATDEVVIPETGLTITKTGGSIDVLSLNSNSALSLSGVSLTVTSGASQVGAALTMTGASALTAQGAGTTFTAMGTTVIDGTSVTATGGGQVTLPGVTSYQATATDSISALSGGVVSLPNLTAVSVTGSGSTANLLADGAGSLIDVAALTTISGTSGLTATHQGTVNAPLLTSLDGTAVTLDGTGTLPTAQIGTLTDGQLTVGGGSYDFSGLSHLDNSGVSVSGGITVSLPGVTGYQAGSGTLQASGAGSVLALPGLAVLTDTAFGDSGSVKALSGGEVTLPNLDAVSVSPGSTVGLLADGSGSLLNLPALVGISGPSSLTATHQGAIVAPLITGLTGTALTLDGTGTLPTAQLISFTGGQLNLAANTNFSGLTDIDGTSVVVSGGASESLPGVTSYQPGTATLEASGAGSVLTLPHLTQVTESGAGTTLAVSALAGGEVSLPLLTTLAVTGNNAVAQLLADGTNSSLNLPDLTALDGSSGAVSSFTLSNGAVAAVSPAGLAVIGAVVNVGSGSTLTGPLTLDAGSILAGQGTIQGNVVNTAGTVAPGDPHRINIHGDYHQGPNGTLNLEIEGTTPATEYDQVFISGTAYLDGTLSVTYLNGYLPQIADTYQVMTYAAVVGDFAAFQQFNEILTEDLTPSSLYLVADTIAVTTTADSGDGSLRQAITTANNRPQATLIYFAIPRSGVQTITPMSPLPPVTAQVIIDGTTQAGYAGTPVVRLDGSASGGADGLVLTGGNSTVRGLAIGGFQNAIVLSGNGNDTVKGDYLGVNTDGASAFPNSADGLVLDGAGNNTITGNVVGDNGHDGVALIDGASGNLVQSNTITGNTAAGIAVTGTSTGDALRGNVLSGNGGPGIDLGDNGRTPNDSAGHTGPNDYQDFPVLTGATLGQVTVVQGQLQLPSALSATFTLDFYASPVTEPGGGARASVYLGSAQVSTDSNGLAKFNDPFGTATTAGEYVTATATDAAGDTSELSDPLQGTLYNPPPSVTITGPGSIHVGPAVAFGSQVSDAATDRTFTYLWTVTEDGNPSFQLPDGTVVDEPNFAFTPATVGTYRLTLVVTDNLGATGQASFALGVTPQPVSVALTGGPSYATPFTTIALTGTVETPPGTSLTGAPAWSATLNGQPFPLPPGGTDSAGRPTLSFVVPGPGNYAVLLSAANNTGGTGAASFGVGVSNGVQIVGLPSTSRSSAPLQLSATVDDPNLVGSLTYDWSVTHDGSPFASQNGADPTFSFTPDLPGAFAVTVAVTDANGHTVSASASTVVPSTLAILDLPGRAFTGQSVTLEATGFSPSPASSVHWAVFNAAGHVVGFGSGASFTYVPTDAGLDLITLTCPGQATSATLPIYVASVTVTLSGNPTPPQGGPLTLTADLGGTTGGASYTYAWTITNGTGQVVASGPGTPVSTTRGTFTFTPALPGPYAVKVTVLGSDFTYGAATSSFTVIDVPPTVAFGGAPAGAVPEGTFIHLAALANDPGGTSDVLRFAWTLTGPDGFSRSGTNSTLDFVPVEAGSYPVAVTVTDSSGESATISTSIAVSHVQPVAVISSGPGTHIDPVAGVATIQVMANVPDPGSDGDNFQYNWLVTDDTQGGAVVAQQSPGATNSSSFTFSGPSADNYTLTLRVTDDDGGDATVVVPIRIGVTSSVTLTNGNVPSGSSLVLGVAFDGTTIDASGLSVPFAGVALGSHDTLIGGSGPNVLQGDSGFNMLEGGSGPNTMYATGGDTLVGGSGHGTDLFALIPPPADAPSAPISLQPDASRQSTLSFAQAATGVSFNASLTGGQDQNLATGDSVELFGAVQQVVGSPGNDSLVAGNGTTLFGGGGNDTLVANGGSNIALVAGSQADLLTAQGIADVTLFGTSGSGSAAAPGTGTPITLFGGSGQSLLVSNNSNNVTLIGGSGNTTLSASGGTSVTLFGGSGNAMLTSSNANNVSMLGGSGNDSLSASGGTNVTLFGGSGNSLLSSSNANNVSMIGGSGNDSLSASNGSSITLFGGSGNASLTSSNGNNVSMLGGSGNTTLSASGGTSITLFGGSGNAMLTSSNGNNVSMLGGSGNDSLSASGGTNVTLFGGSGNASLTSSNGNNVSMVGGSGNDSLTATGGTQVTLFGGTGNDLLQASGATQVVLAGGSGDTQLKVSDSTEVTLFGGAGNTTLTSANSNNVSMVGGSGSATLAASGGTSVTLFGGSGNASLSSSNGNNVSMLGGGGNDTLSATGGTNVTLFGGSGNSLLTSTNGNSVTMVGGSGNDTLTASGGTSITLFGGSGNAMLTSSNGNNVSMVGGGGNDTLAASGGTSVTLFGGSGNSMLTSNNGNSVTMIGGSGNDTLTASSGTNITLFGGSGNAMLTSTNSNNVSMVGGGGSDTLTASNGTSVTLFGGSGNDSLTSTNGNNVSMLGGSGNATLAASNGTSVTLFGGSGNDLLTSTNSNNVTMVGGSGNATLSASNGSGVTLFGGSGNDSLTSANSNNVSMVGGSGAATLTASGGTSVTLFGGAGSDLLASSNDVTLAMTGGAGGDTLTSANDTDAVLTSGGLNGDRLAVTDGTDVTVMGGGGNDTLAATGGTGISLSGLDGDNLYQLTGTPADPLDVALNDLGTFGAAIASTDGTSDGINTLAFPGVSSGITLDLSNASLGTVPGAGQWQQAAPGLSLALTGFFQNVTGTPGANWIKGDSAANVLQGQGGNDTLIGGSGPATLVAGDGTDLLMGGSGGTTYHFAGTGLGSVTVAPASDASDDTLDFSQLGGPVALDLTTAAAQPVSPAAGLSLTVTQPLGITGVVDTAFADAIAGNARDDVFTVQGGNDTFVGGGGNDTYLFSAASRGAKVLDETATTNNTLNFHDFDGPVNVNLTQSGPQAVSPGSLTLTLAPPTAFDSVIGTRFSDTIVGNDRGNTLIGGGGGDRITAGSGADTIQTGITQVVYLNFDAGSQPGEHVYTQDERGAIQARLEAIYEDFSYVFTQDPAQAAQLAQATGGQFATLSFNVGPYPGASRLLDTDRLDLGGSATININPALGSSAGLVPDVSADVIGLTATIAAHELGHLSGLEHGDAFGPIDTGIYAGVNPAEFTPAYPANPALLMAVDTPSDVMASPASVNSPLIDAAEPTQLGERDALHLAFDDSGKLLRSQDLTGLVEPVSGVAGVTSAVVLGELPQLAVPNSLIDPGTTGYGQTFQAVALGVEGTIAAPGQEDFYAITGHAGEVMSFEVASEDNTLNPRPFPPELEVLDSSGNRLGYNVRNFESADPMLFDLTLPADGTYYVGVDALGEQATGDYRLLMYSLSAVASGAPQGNGATVTSSGGNDTLVGSSANDVFVYLANAAGQVTVPSTGGAKVLDLRLAPQVTYVQTGDPTLGSLTVLRGTGIATSVQLGASPGSLAFGQPVTFTATVVPADPVTTPSGQIDFVDTTTGLDLGTVDLADGSASVMTTALGGGTHVIAADYSGDDLFLPNSGTTTVQVSGSVEATNVSVTSSSANNTSTYGQTVTFTADVTATDPGANSAALAGETIAFEDGGTVLGMGTLNASGVATWTTSATQLAAGGHPITAVYAGDGTFQGNSGTLTGGQTVNTAGTSTALTSSSPNNTSNSGDAVTFTATVSSNVPGAPAPAGPVSFYDGGAFLGRGTLDANGQATLTTSTLPAGQDTIQAVYDDATDAGATLNPNFVSSSDSLVQTVNSGGPVDVTDDVQISRSGLSANRRAGTFSGTIGITNTSEAAISGSLIFVWKDLAAGVSVQSVSVTIDGVTIPLTVQPDGQGNSEVVISSQLLAQLAVGQTIALNVVYSDPTFTAVNFVPDLFSDPSR